jgi:cell division protein FtsW (lipid II flippase)
MERFRGIGWFLAGVTVALVTYLLPDRSSLTPVEFVIAVGLLVVDVAIVVVGTQKKRRTPPT